MRSLSLKMPIVLLLGLIIFAPGAEVVLADAATLNLDSGQDRCYSDTREIPCPAAGQPFYGQDAQYRSQSPGYRDNGDGTISDLNTGLMWSRAVDPRKVSLDEATEIAAKMTLGGHSDWRVPSIKELYSLIDFRGNTGFPGRDMSRVPADAIPFINTDYFDFSYGDVTIGERYIDAQWLSSTSYVSTTMDSMETLFGVNFADGRIKGYGFRRVGTDRVVKTFFARYVRGDVYGQNDFIDNGDGTVTDRSSGLTWMQIDSGRGMNWQEALAYAEQLDYAGYSDWRLPNARELQYIVDYSRSPDTTDSPAIDPLFKTTAITNEAGQRDYPYFWTSTTHHDGPNSSADAVYLAFGRALGQMRGMIMDVHGAGAQRSDPKQGRAELGHGPQGDARRVDNYVRCVRGGATATTTKTISADAGSYPHRIVVKQVKVLNSLHARHPQGGDGDSSHQGFDGRPGQGAGGIAGAPPGGEDFINRLDRDHDGRVSRAEFDGPPDRFDVHDRDRDGYITAEEARQWPPPGDRARPAR